MILSPTDEQSALAERLRALGTTLGADLAERERTCSLQPGDWQRCADAGVFALPVPAESGGLGLDPLTCALALEGLGRGCRDNGLLIAVGAHVWAMELPLLHFGSEEHKRRYLPALVDGSSIGAHAITEAGSGSDALSLSATARREGDHYVLDGTKRFVTNAPVADVFIVYATVNPELGFTGVTAFLVDRDTPGLTVETGFEKMGLRTAPWGEVVLRDCRVPVANRLGAEKQGSKILATAMAWERSLILAPLLGTMQRQIDECGHYARSREQFGSIIGRHPSVAHSVVGMQVRLEAAKLLTYRAAWDLGQGITASVFAEAAQLETSESAVQTFLDAVQLFGGLGYTTGTDAERNLRDALGTRISSGTSDMQRKVMADKFGLTVRARHTADGRHTP
ncbi:acyl-CoA dehydrogenase family protein [Streptomyces sp. WI04-05B]|uniref:acyl-CoA dehydrogenase family protein n=1 Tax=Streptomyces TaxID=1883 RepID=UPI0029B7E187|nr:MULTISPECIES: acyl-CoA dehydrogenase family protein [unclassified Streptomyces]MDX2547305.1 acyl-CoA dehydrogenase family protein [Streptomyces sp. WI04-05B]MDX2589793.1 acyl-CoA dehydrogenase family protein [Streptomyces sp. WI04-05A]MDX3753469.1 acyl-CoA dehydrogenase family protein [Streptomyces sp. AK08-02]